MKNLLNQKQEDENSMNTGGKFILDGKNVIECTDLMEWGRWMEDANRRVEQTQIGDVRISTVFLGLDHGWNDKVELFETMIFGGKLDQQCWRYATWDEAKVGHAVAVSVAEKAA